MTTDKPTTTAAQGQNVRNNVGQSAAQYNCQQCKRVMSVIDVIMGAVCMQCCRFNHKRATGRGK